MHGFADANAAYKGVPQEQGTFPQGHLSPGSTQPYWRPAYHRQNSQDSCPYQHLQVPRPPIGFVGVTSPYHLLSAHVPQRLVPGERPSVYLNERTMTVQDPDIMSLYPFYTTSPRDLRQKHPTAQFNPFALPTSQFLQPRFVGHPEHQQINLQPATTHPRMCQVQAIGHPEVESDNIVVASRPVTAVRKPVAEQRSDLASFPVLSSNDKMQNTHSTIVRATASVQQMSEISAAAPMQPPLVQISFGADQGNVQGGASPQSSSFSGNIQVPETDEDLSQRQPIDISRTGRPSASQEMLQAKLYGRERNPRRAATSRYREPAAPGAISKRARQPVQLIVPLPSPKELSRNDQQTSIRQTGTVSAKRRRTSDLQQATLQTHDTIPATIGTITLVRSLRMQDQRITYRWPRPRRSEADDRKFVRDVLDAFEPQCQRRIKDMGRRQANRISALLKQAEYPSENEARFLDMDEAGAAVASGEFFQGPIVTVEQQTLPLQTIEQFLDEYYEDGTEVWIQDPSARLHTKNAEIARKVKMSMIKERFARPADDQPWNCLELATHCDDGLRPSFLNTEDCRLLTKLKIPNSADHARRRVYEVGFKEVEKWALLAQAGALTEPHQDSHGYSTFITVNVGQVGFGWLCQPTDEERAGWRADPLNYTGGNWRCLVLQPNQTIYFPAGTVHFVFRLPSAGPTLAFGGHILRCSTIVHWVQTLLEERDQKNVTNEDLTDSVTGYLDRVERFVKQAVAQGRTGKWGGEENIEEFLRLKVEFERVKQK